MISSTFFLQNRTKNMDSFFYFFSSFATGNLLFHLTIFYMKFDMNQHEILQVLLKKMLSTRKTRKSKTINIIVYPGIVDEINPHFKIMGSFRFKLPLNGQQMDSQGKQTSLNPPPSNSNSSLS